jgi:hypothetical protein
MDSQELPLDWSCVPSRSPDSAAGLPDAMGDVGTLPWLDGLDERDRRTVAALAADHRPLLFLIDPRNRWHLVEPRLRIAGLDASDLVDRPEGEFRMMLVSDVDPMDVAHLLRTFRELRPPRSVVTERMPFGSLQLKRLASLRNEDRREVNTHPEVRRKNSGTGA